MFINHVLGRYGLSTFGTIVTGSEDHSPTMVTISKVLASTEKHENCSEVLAEIGTLENMSRQAIWEIVRFRLSKYSSESE